MVMMTALSINNRRICCSNHPVLGDYSRTMSFLFQLFFLFLHFCSTCTSSLNLTSPSETIISNSDVRLPIDVSFTFPAPIPKWTNQGQGFGSGGIDLGGLEVRQIKTFKRIWKTFGGGPFGNGATFFEPFPIPDGFHMLGSYAQSNGKPLFGSVLVAKALAKGTLSQPMDYILVWSGGPTAAYTTDGVGYIWRPVPPNGYKSIGYIVTTTSEKPPLDKVRCVRSDFTDTCDNDFWIWEDHGLNFFKLRPSNRGIGSRGMSAGTFYIQKPIPCNELSCLINLRNDFVIMPNKSQIIALVDQFSPVMYHHPKEDYLPGSVEWLFDNRAFLYKKGGEYQPIKIGPLGSNLPTNMSGAGMYWIDLNNGKTVKHGDTSKAATYLHIKPMLGATYTDIVIWLFYPYNGNAKLRQERYQSPVTGKWHGPFEFSLGPVGEHIGDWEHVTLRISNFDGELKSVYFSQHKNGIWMSAADLIYKQKLNKFTAFSCFHSHALEPFPVNAHYQQVGTTIFLIKEAEKGPIFLDTGFRYSIISAEYLGSEFPEPNWVRFPYDWGPIIEYRWGHEIKDFVAHVPDIFQKFFHDLLSKVPPEVLGEEGPVGPKSKNSWSGDENIDSGGVINLP